MREVSTPRELGQKTCLACGIQSCFQALGVGDRDYGICFSMNDAELQALLHVGCELVDDVPIEHRRCCCGGGGAILTLTCSLSASGTCFRERSREQELRRGTDNKAEEATIPVTDP